MCGYLWSRAFCDDERSTRRGSGEPAASVVGSRASVWISSRTSTVPIPIALPTPMPRTMSSSSPPPPPPPPPFRGDDGDDDWSSSSSLSRVQSPHLTFIISDRDTLGLLALRPLRPLRPSPPSLVVVVVEG